MSDTLKKIEYNNLTQFLEDINSNLAIIQNSPLFKGIAGKGGNKGDVGLMGSRGSQLIFAYYAKFNAQFPGENASSSGITLSYINSKLSSFEGKKKLLVALGVTEFVNNDIVVLPTSEMISFVFVNSVFVSTGQAFNKDTGLTANINQIVDIAVNNAITSNSTLTNLQILFERYNTIGKNFADKDGGNTDFGNLADSSLLFPIVDSLVNPNNGAQLTTNYYIGINKDRVGETETSSLVLGSIKRYIDLLNKTVTQSTTETLTSAYGPGRKNIPSLIILQNTDTDGSGILIGKRNDTNLKSFASIYKDAQNNLVFKSHGGQNTPGSTEYSKLIISKVLMSYDKDVRFYKNLQIDGDLHFSGKLTSPALNILRSRDVDLDEMITFINIGSGDYSYVNLDIERITLPYWGVGNVLITQRVQDYFGTTTEISKNYWVETNYNGVDGSGAFPYYNALQPTTGLEPANRLRSSGASQRFITSNYINDVLTKVDNVSNYVKLNYWTKTNWQDSSINVAIKIAGNFETTKDFRSPMITSSVVDKWVGLGVTTGNTDVFGTLHLKQYLNKLLVTNQNGTILQDYTTDTEDLSQYKVTGQPDVDYSIVPISSADALTTIPINVGNRSDKKALTGSNFNFILKSLDNIKKRFKNTFNKTEAISQIYDTVGPMPLMVITINWQPLGSKYHHVKYDVFPAIKSLSTNKADYALRDFEMYRHGDPASDNEVISLRFDFENGIIGEYIASTLRGSSSSGNFYVAGQQGSWVANWGMLNVFQFGVASECSGYVGVAGQPGYKTTNRAESYDGNGNLIHAGYNWPEIVFRVGLTNSPGYNHTQYNIDTPGAWARDGAISPGEQTQIILYYSKMDELHSIPICSIHSGTIIGDINTNIVP